MTSEIIQWRDDLELRPQDAAMTAGAYWSWTQAAQFADQKSDFVYQLKNNDSGFAFYINDSFTKVAATINVGEPQADTSSVNGLESRFQAYASAIVALADVPEFPDVKGNIGSTPVGFKPRRSS